jgi:hypothetical protein
VHEIENPDFDPVETETRRALKVMILLELETLHNGLAVVSSTVLPLYRFIQS